MAGRSGGVVNVQPASLGASARLLREAEEWGPLGLRWGFTGWLVSYCRVGLSGSRALAQRFGQHPLQPFAVGSGYRRLTNALPVVYSRRSSASHPRSRYVPIVFSSTETLPVDLDVDVHDDDGYRFADADWEPSPTTT